ncbi:hypothetical protein B0H19DRAFT_1373139, partial [Mycena capillaripes]
MIWKEANARGLCVFRRSRDCIGNPKRHARRTKHTKPAGRRQIPEEIKKRCRRYPTPQKRQKTCVCHCGLAEHRPHRLRLPLQARIHVRGLDRGRVSLILLLCGRLHLLHTYTTRSSTLLRNRTLTRAPLPARGGLIPPPSPSSLMRARIHLPAYLYLARTLLIPLPRSLPLLSRPRSTV